MIYRECGQLWCNDCSDSFVSLQACTMLQLLSGLGKSCGLTILRLWLSLFCTWTYLLDLLDYPFSEIWFHPRLPHVKWSAKAATATAAADATAAATTAATAAADAAATAVATTTAVTNATTFPTTTAAVADAAATTDNLAVGKLSGAGQDSLGKEPEHWNQVGEQRTCPERSLLVR